MAILRRCRGSRSNPRRCLDHLWFDVMYAGARYRMAANDFAVPRMGDLPDRHPGRDDEGQGEPARAVQPGRAAGGGASGG